MLVVVDLRGLADAVGTALEEDVLAEDVAWIVGRHQRRVQHREAGRHFAADVVLGVADLHPKPCAGGGRPIQPGVALQAVLHRHGGDLRAEVEAADGAAGAEFLQQPAVGRAAGVRNRASQGRHVETAGIAEAAGGRAQPVHLAKHQAAAVQVAGRQQKGGVLPQLAADHPVQSQIVLAAVVGAGAVLHLQFRALVVPLGDEVHHPGHGVRTVDGGGAVLQHLHPLHRQHGHQGGHIDEAGAIVGLRRGGDLTLAVEQHQGGGDPQTAQIDVGGAGGEVLGQVVRVVLRAVVDGQHPHQIADVLGGLVAQVLRPILRQRRRRTGLALDAAAGPRRHHDDFLNFILSD